MFKYLFLDADNTLCHSRQVATPEMVVLLKRLPFHLIFVSGAQIERIKHQLPVTATCMAQNGNEVWEDDRVLWKNELDNRPEIMEHIARVAKHMKISITDDMVEDRGGQISFSLLGHSVDIETKKRFDGNRKVRRKILDEFPFRAVHIGGTSSLDYVPVSKGENIRRYITDFNIPQSECLYLGDAFGQYGNDATVLGVIPTFQVDGPDHSYSFLESLL